MKSIKRVLVGIDYSDMDKSLLEYTKFLADLISPLSITFINISEPDDVLIEISELIGSIDEISDEKKRIELKNYVNKNWTDSDDYEIEYVTRSGSPTKEILSYISKYNMDLVVLGRKDEMGLLGLFPTQIARKADADVLLIPKNNSNRIENIYLPVDFSDNSLKAFNAVCDLSNQISNAKIYAEYFFNLPIGYNKTGKTEKEFKNIIIDFSKKKFEKLIEKVDTVICNKVYFEPTYSNGMSISRHINQSAHKNNSDIIFIGAKGRTFVSNILLGSKTEKLIRKEKSIPIWIVKEKGQVYDVFSALREI